MRSGYEKGYKVITLSDCVAATSAEEHENAIKFDYPMFSEVMSPARSRRSCRARWRRADMPAVTAASTGWWIGLALGIVVIAVAAVIVIAGQAGPEDRGPGTGAVEGVEVVRAQTDELAGIARINDSGCGSCTRRARCERWRSAK